ncbi:conserved hypothetical protein [Pediculus humanus corporis]|uniref:Uncharacterized protein n=1 Tax=Pediculus humanus subsp. corporis TaxID=121224 RepID=E0VXL1_PEDHC|nr:uncharacterized protein Phum_PHUM502030 [Pediculus humanus corporis]EEB18117.1 conserved hypothetical protein [Pediculus humanus corporis]
MERRQVNDYDDSKENARANTQYSLKEYKSSNKQQQQQPIIRNSAKILGTTTKKTIEKKDSKRIPSGAILGISKTMQKFNEGVKNGQKIDETTTIGYPSTDSISNTEGLNGEEEDVKPVVVSKGIEIVEKESSNNEKEESDEEFLLVEETGDAFVEQFRNGHARPNYSTASTTTSTTTTTTPAAASTTASTTTTTTVLPNTFIPKRDYSDEPWKPIIPPYREAIRIRNSYHEKYPERVFEQHQHHHHHHPHQQQQQQHGPLSSSPVNDDSLITFSKNSFEENLRISPEYAGYNNDNNNNNNNNFMIKKSEENNFESESDLKYQDFFLGATRTDEMEKIKKKTPPEIVTAPPGVSTGFTGESNDNLTMSIISSYNLNKQSDEKYGVVSIDKKSSQMKSEINVVKNDGDVENVTSSVVVPHSKPQTTPKSATIKAVLKVEEVEEEEEEDKEESPSQSFNKKDEKKNYSKIYESSDVKYSSHFTPISLEFPVPTSESVSRKNYTTLENGKGDKIEEIIDNSRSSSSNFNLDLPDLPILKQFQHLESLFKDMSKTSSGNSGVQNVYSRIDVGNETTIMMTRFPARTRPTTTVSFKKEDTIYVEVSTVSPENSTRRKIMTVKPSTVIKGEVEVVSGPVKKPSETMTTETPKLITLLPVRSNVNMMRPLRPRPKSNVRSTLIITNRNSKMNSGFKNEERPAETTTTTNGRRSSQREHVINDKYGKRWVYYPSYKPTSESSPTNDKLYIVTPEPKLEERKDDFELEEKFNFTENLTTVPIYNTIETLLNLDNRNRNSIGKNKTSSSTLSSTNKNRMDNMVRKNTSDIVQHIVKIMENVAISTGDSNQSIIKVNQTLMNKTSE